MIKRAMFIAFGFCMISATEEYRQFKDVSGRSIEAKVIRLDPKTNRVELEMRNGKTGRIPLSQLDLTEEDERFFSELKIGTIFSDADQVLVNITEKTAPHYDAGTKKNGKQHTYTFAISNQSDLDFQDVHVEYCIYRDLGSNKNRSTNLELASQDLLAGKAASIESTQTHATFKSSGKMTISGVRLRLFFKMPDGSYAIREQCFPKPLSLATHPWARSKREMEEERNQAPAATSYPAREMTENELRELAEAYAGVWKSTDYETWKQLLNPMHVGRQELESGWFQRTADRIKYLKITKVDGRNVRMRVTYTNKDDDEGWLQITPSGHIKYTPVIFKHPFKKACSSLGMMGSTWPHFRESSAETLTEMDIPLSGFNPQSKQNAAAINQIHTWLSNHRSTFDISEPHIYFPEADARDALEGARNMLNFFENN